MFGKCSALQPIIIMLIQNIKELLGHWSVSETERYAHNNSEHLHQDVSELDNLLRA
jgi:integrase